MTFAHLVGSIPVDTAEEAIAEALGRLGPHLRWVPDGETGERRNWIIAIVESFRRHPDLELRRDGGWTGYKDLPAFRVRRGHTLRGDALDLGHVAAFECGYPVLRRLRQERRRPDLSYQVGLPGDFDMAMFTFGPAGALRHRRAFTDATVGEIRAIHAQAGDDVVFQIEVPAELVLVARMPAAAQPVIARLFARGIANLAARSPEGARFGVHLCLGDMNHRALGRMRDVGPLVHLANATAEAWPSGRPLEFVHAPLAAAIEPPPNRAAFYRPLRGLRLPVATEFIAGFVHEAVPMDAQRILHEHLVELTGRDVGIATSCGLGRRDRDAGLATMDLAAALCEPAGADIRS